MVTLLGLLKECQILIQHLLLGECDTVDTCHLRALLVTAPVCGRCSQQLDGLDGTCVNQMRSAAKVCIITLSVSGDGTVLQILDELVLVTLAAGGEELKCIGL